MARAVSFRPIAPEDGGLLYRIYASTRTEELAQVPWSDAQKEAFLRMQFTAQSTDYAANYPDAEFLLILLDGEPAGRLYVHDRPGELWIVDIALLPDFRGAGAGSALLRDIQARAARAGKPLRIHVEVYNPALRLYERLGFRRVGGDGMYHLLEWRDPRAGSADAANPGNPTNPDNPGTPGDTAPGDAAP